MPRLPALVLLSLVSASVAAAQTPRSPAASPAVPVPAVPIPAAPQVPDTPATIGYRDAMTRMMEGMEVPVTGDADRDFVAAMIPHHQGAIDMAAVELKYGRDPALKKLARDIIAAQKDDIAFMEQWQKKFGK